MKTMQRSNKRPSNPGLQYDKLAPRQLLAADSIPVSGNVTQSEYYCINESAGVCTLDDLPNSSFVYTIPAIHSSLEDVQVFRNASGVVQIETDFVNRQNNVDVALAFFEGSQTLVNVKVDLTPTQAATNRKDAYFYQANLQNPGNQIGSKLDTEDFASNGYVISTRAANNGDNIQSAPAGNSKRVRTIITDDGDANDVKANTVVGFYNHPNLTYQNAFLRADTGVYSGGMLRVEQGANISLVGNIENMGTSQAGNSTLQTQLRAPNGSQFNTRTSNVSSLPAGTSSPINSTAHQYSTSGLQPGIYELIFSIDHFDSVQERDEVSVGSAPYKFNLDPATYTSNNSALSNSQWNHISSFMFEVLPPLAQQEIAVTGNGINISDGSSNPNAADGTLFESVVVGEASAPHNFTITNQGDLPLTLMLNSIPNGFDVSGLPSQLAGGQSHTFSVTLNSEIVGLKSGDIVILNNDSNEGVFNFRIQGEVVAATIDINETNGTQVEEGATTDSYSVGLSSPPSGTVSVTASTTDGQSELSLDGVNYSASQTMTFSSTVPQVIFVRAIDDATFEGTHSSLISHEVVASTDTLKYPVGMDIADVNVTVFDNDSAFAEIGEAGIISDVTDAWQTINLTNSYVDPVIVFGPVSTMGQDPVVVQIQNKMSDRFDVRLKEFQYLNQQHLPETVSYVVMESGNYELEDGTKIEARNSETDHNFTDFEFTQNFENAPVVVSQTTTVNGTDEVMLRHKNISRNGFATALQEQQAANQLHTNESFSWIASEIGTGLSNGLRFESNTTGDNVTHLDFALQFTTPFENPPVFLASLQTFDGSDPSSLRYRDVNPQGSSFYIQEERSADNEISHTTENVGYVAFEQGLIFGNPSGSSRIAPQDDASLGGLVNHFKSMDSDASRDGNDISRARAIESSSNVQWLEGARELAELNQQTDKAFEDTLLTEPYEEWTWEG